MKKFVQFILIALVLTGCQVKRDVTMVDGIKYKTIIPPGTVKIKDNFYADQTEITNLDYREFVYWLKRVFGEKSDTYLKSLPDTTVWKWKDTICISCSRLYFRHYNFENYPVVGISYQQAMAYTVWRSDRVFEMLLIGKGIIKTNCHYDSNSYFTIPRYLSGQYLNYKPDKSIPYPEYRLPTLEEWEYLASGGLDIKQYPYGYKCDSIMKCCIAEYLIPIKLSDSTFYLRTVPVKSYSPNKFKLYQTIGNVAEMTLDEGVAKGGSFYHSINESKIRDEIKYDKPEAWLGFRNVCSWQVYK
jgi:formylglycine-generating enzyme required for sulfatase activity